MPSLEKEPARATLDARRTRHGARPGLRRALLRMSGPTACPAATAISARKTGGQRTELESVPTKMHFSHGSGSCRAKTKR